MRVIEAARRGRIKVVQDGKGGVTIEGRRGDVVRIQKAVEKRERKNAKRLVTARLDRMSRGIERVLAESGYAKA